MKSTRLVCGIGILLVLSVEISSGQLNGQSRNPDNSDQRIRDEDLPWPPQLPDRQTVVSDQSDMFLQPPATLQAGVQIAGTVPRIDFLFYPQQTYPGKPWSNWGDGVFADGHYYSAIGDHYAVGRGDQRFGSGTALVYKYHPASRRLTALVNVSSLLNLPADQYTPGKIHSRVDLGSDGWLYYATHRGSPKAAVDANGYRGDWILRTHPESGRSEIVVAAPVPRHSIPASVLDPERLIFYGGTAAGPDAADQRSQFFAYDLRQKRLLCTFAEGPARCLILARSTGRVYFVSGNRDGHLYRFDPATGHDPERLNQKLGLRAATAETADGMVYTVSSGQRSEDAAIWRFDTTKELAEQIGTVKVGRHAYVTSIDVDPTGRYLYYVPGAHGGADADGSPLVQFDVSTGRKKVIAFLQPFYQQKYGFVPRGSYSSAVSADGAMVFITWNISRGTRAWDCCGLAVIHIPPEER